MYLSQPRHKALHCVAEMAAPPGCSFLGIASLHVTVPVVAQWPLATGVLTLSEAS
jgi:hypothetical protein